MADYNIPGASSDYVQAVRAWWCVLEEHPTLPIDIGRARYIARGDLTNLLVPDEQLGANVTNAVEWLKKRYGNLHRLSPKVPHQAVEVGLRYLVYGSPWHWACRQLTKHTCTRWPDNVGVAALLPGGIPPFGIDVQSTATNFHPTNVRETDIPMLIYGTTVLPMTPVVGTIYMSHGHWDGAIVIHVRKGFDPDAVEKAAHIGARALRTKLGYPGGWTRGRDTDYALHMRRFRQWYAWKIGEKDEGRELSDSRFARYVADNLIEGPSDWPYDERDIRAALVTARDWLQPLDTA